MWLLSISEQNMCYGIWSLDFVLIISSIHNPPSSCKRGINMFHLKFKVWLLDLGSCNLAASPVSEIKTTYLGKLKKLKMTYLK